MALCNDCQSSESVIPIMGVRVCKSCLPYRINGAEIQLRVANAYMKLSDLEDEFEKWNRGISPPDDFYDEDLPF